ncbi:hypothetical protein KOR42_32040 [Thalassoglobus neptunius]|uniref:Uncharacterized protein n=1 Tax=Thalassoglobus neptunius TaxID=1938619 RepID=A0A5C5WQ29_9PLAN|nr:hypothetical protein KOR42_32040 [Thalassoglobus neptunius]
MIDHCGAESVNEREGQAEQFERTREAAEVQVSTAGLVRNQVIEVGQAEADRRATILASVISTSARNSEFRNCVGHIVRCSLRSGSKRDWLSYSEANHDCPDRPVSLQSPCLYREREEC